MKGKKAIRICVLALLLAIVLGLFTACSTANIPLPEVKEGIYIYDQADIIDDDVESDINIQLLDLKEKTGIEFAVIAVNSHLNINLADYSKKLFDAINMGKKDENNRFLFIISSNESKAKFFIDENIKKRLTDKEWSKLSETFIEPNIKVKDYNYATEVSVELLIEELINVENEGETDNEKETSPFMKVVYFIVFVLVMFVALSSDKDSYIDPDYLENDDNDSD
jgi:uncharacterized protein